MWYSDHQLGYSSKGDRTHYDVNIASDYPDKEVQQIVLIHELAHCYYGHLTIDFNKEFKAVKELFKTLGKPYSMIRTYGGPLSFLNVCMDCEVNSKALTIANVKKMNSFFSLCTPEAYEIEVLDDFRDYYAPLIEKLPDNDKELEQFKKDLQKKLGGNGAEAPDWMKDLPGSSTSDDSDIQKELNRESYNGGNSKAQKDNVEEVEDLADLNADENFQETNSKEAGSSHTLGKALTVVENSDKNIMKFLASIIKTDLEYQQDPMRHYIRGTRRNSEGILYKSNRRKVQESKRKLDILIDCSGSMDSSTLLKALGSLKKSISLVAPNSMIVTWDTYKCEEFPINRIPKSVRSGGGTDMAAGMEYLIKNGATDIVLYSDMGTSIPPMIELLKKHHVDMYTIAVNAYECEELNDFFKLNRNVLRVK